MEETLVDNRLFVMHHAPIKKRKGEIIGSQTDSSLSEYGIEVARRQANRVRQLLGSSALEGIGQIILSSPLRRAVQTSEIIAKKCDMDILIDDRLKAQDFGILDGMTFDEILNNDALRHNLWDYIPETSRDSHKDHGGESNAEMVDRVAEFTKETIPAYNRIGTPLVITHGTVIDAMIASIDRRRLDEIEGKNRVFEGRVIKLTNDQYKPIGDPLSAFCFIPGVVEQESLEQQKSVIRNYIQTCDRPDERVHLNKLMDIFDREVGGI